MSRYSQKTKKIIRLSHRVYPKFFASPFLKITNKIRNYPFFSKKKFGVMYASTYNLGDLIQTLAQIEALKKLGITKYIFIDREKLASYSGEPVNLLMSGWYTKDLNQFPPNSKINPIFISIHINEERLISLNRDFFLKYEPIGCRDEHTVQLFKKHKIKAYLTKCLTLIFDQYCKERQNTYLVEIFPCGKYNYNPPVLSDKFFHSFPLKFEEHITHNKYKITQSNLHERLREVQQILEIYRKAELVITTRLHCALPCRAFGTPVVFVHPKYQTSRRFSGLHQELNGSDGTIEFEKLESKIDYKLIAKDQENLLSDLKQKLEKI
jgi:hypothetical protein